MKLEIDGIRCQKNVKSSVLWPNYSLGLLHSIKATNKMLISDKNMYRVSHRSCLKGWATPFDY